MFTLFDRQLTYSFVKAYIFCLISLLGMYVVIDLFMNLDDFTRDGSFADTVNYIVTYYGYKTTQIFDRLAEAIALLAAMFTVAWMQRATIELLRSCRRGFHAARGPPRAAGRLRYFGPERAQSGIGAAEHRQLSGRSSRRSRGRSGKRK